MGSCVSLEATSCCAGVFALFANERLLSTVNQHVDFQMRSFVACVAALVATVGLLSVMLLKPMLFQVIAHLGVEISLYTQVGHLCWHSGRIFSILFAVDVEVGCLMFLATKL